MTEPSVPQLEALLSAALGRPVRIRATRRLSPWSVLRCELDGAPGSVIAKWLRDDPSGFRTDPRQVATELAALEFLASIGFAQAPRPIAADLAADLLVLEDLSPCTPLADLIRRDGADAARAPLTAFAEAMGALGAATAGKAGDYTAKRARYGAPDPSQGIALGLGAGWADTRACLEALGQAMSGAASAELAAAAQALLNPGPFLALSNGDPEANNFLVREDGGKVIDFETAAFRHALTSATWIHIPGPAWITVSAPVVAAEIEDDYRRVLAAAVPEAADDRQFGFGLAAACAALAYERLNRFPRLDARPPGDPSRVQMVATLEAAAGVARRHRAMPDLAGWMLRTAEWLRRRWPDADVDLAALPAYTRRH
jgi:hypothetical protein